MIGRYKQYLEPDVQHKFSESCSKYCQIMIKSLSVLRIHCAEFRLFYQAAVCCRTITMSNSPGKPPPIGAFVINPLPVSTGNQTDVCVTREKEDVGSVSGNSIVIEKKEIGNVDKFVNDVDKFVDDVDKFVNDVDKLLKISKDDRSSGSTRGTNGDKSMPGSAHDELQDSSMESSVPSSLHNADSLSIGESRLSGKRISSEGSPGTSDNNSKLMMKLTISGPPKCKFDQKKTVLPPSLLQGVTELVRKEQVNQDNGSVSVTSSEEKSICDESHSSVGARPGVLSFENKSQCYSEESNKEDEKAKEQSVDDKESPFEKQDCIKVPCSDSSDTVSSGYVLSIKSATGLQMSKSANLHQGEIDICGSSKLLAEEDKTNVSTPIEASESAHHACPVEACESNVITDLVETKESNGIKDLVETIKPDHKKDTVETNESVCSALPIETNESNNSTHLDGRSHPRDKAQNSDISLNSAVSETETVMSENIDKMSSSNLLNELEIEHEVNPFSEMDFDDLLDGDFKSPDVSVGFHENKETDFGNSDAGFKICSEELLHIDASVLGKKSAKAGDIVYNLSDLFSGELEQRRKKELRKQKRQAKKLERFLKKKKKSVGADTTDKTDTGDKEEKPRKPVPNYFVAIQITDQKIKSGLKAVQDKVVSENKKLQPALNKLATLHLTMMVLSLKTQENMERSRQALDKASEKLLSQYTDMSLQLEVSGLGNFRNNVVFAKVKHEHQISTLKNVADIVEECFMEQEVISPDQRGFKPHITIMKLSSVKGSKKKGLKKIDEKLYSDFLDTDFGSENISMLQLCAMMKPKDKQGYYQVEHRVQFAKMQDSDTAKPGPDTTGEKPDQHNEVTEESDMNISEQTVSEKNTEAPIVENMKELKDVDSKQVIMAGPEGDVIEEALNKISDSSDLTEKVITESNIKTEIEYVPSASADSSELGNDNILKELSEVCFKQDAMKYDSNIVQENAISDKDTDLQKGNDVQIELTEVVEKVSQNKNSLQDDPKELNSDISVDSRIKDINLEDEGTVGIQVNLVTEVSKVADQSEINEIDETTKESHESINVHDAQDISVEIGIPQIREISKEFSADDDSAIDISMDIESSKLSEIDSSVDNDSVLVTV